jgi:hypothetical protein
MNVDPRTMCLRATYILTQRADNQISAARRCVVPETKRLLLREALRFMGELKRELGYLLAVVPERRRASVSRCLARAVTFTTGVEEELAAVVSQPLTLKQICQRALGDRQIMRELKRTMPHNFAKSFKRHLSN